MRFLPLLGLVLFSPLLFPPSPLTAVTQAADAPTTALNLDFSVKELDKSLDIGYAVLLTDINHDGKSDIVVSIPTASSGTRIRPGNAAPSWKG